LNSAKVARLNGRSDWPSTAHFVLFLFYRASIADTTALLRLASAAIIRKKSQEEPERIPVNPVQKRTPRRHERLTGPLRHFLMNLLELHPDLKGWLALTHQIS